MFQKLKDTLYVEIEKRKALRSTNQTGLLISHIPASVAKDLNLSPIHCSSNAGDESRPFNFDRTKLLDRYKRLLEKPGGPKKVT